MKTSSTTSCLLNCFSISLQLSVWLETVISYLAVAIVNLGDLGCVVRDLETIIVLVLLALSPKGLTLTNVAEVTDY